jgi:ADP-ribose pyrophosphatase YjhB (NUDIX family)
MSLRLRHRIMQRGYLAFSRLTRGMTLGVRAMLLDGNEVVLVKHSYVPGWTFPGGGVESGEILEEALEREVREETGAAFTERPQLFGIYRNRLVRTDHVAFYVARHWKIIEKPRLPNREIVACERFALESLPADAAPGALARIGEVMEGDAVSVDW